MQSRTSDDNDEGKQKQKKNHHFLGKYFKQTRIKDV